jgi:hypothetical protein
MDLKITIEISGSPAEVDERLRRFAGDVPIAVGVSHGDAAVYSADDADRLVRRITPDARRVLAYIASHAPNVGFDEVQDTLGIDSRRMGGVTAPIGFAVRAGLPRPYEQDYSARLYIMEPEVASTLLAALDRLPNNYDQAA